jgi:threonine dehydratase
VIAGAGTIGLEIFDSLPEVARVLVPVSGSNVDGETLRRVLQV